jgi:hypothetical protein
VYYAFGGAISAALISSITLTTNELIEVDKRQQLEEQQLEQQPGTTTTTTTTSSTQATTECRNDTVPATKDMVLRSSLVPLVKIPLVNVLSGALLLYLLPSIFATTATTTTGNSNNNH